jgi:hypothetical protein
MNELLAKRSDSIDMLFSNLLPGLGLLLLVWEGALM